MVGDMRGRIAREFLTVPQVHVCSANGVRGSLVLRDSYSTQFGPIISRKASGVAHGADPA